MSEHERYGLRMLVLYEVQYLLGVGLLDEVKRRHLQGALQAIDDFHRLVGTQRFFQDFVGVFDAALGNIFLGRGDIQDFL